MKRITDIVPQKNDKKRVSIFLDGQFFCGIEKITQMTNNLQVGDMISEEKLYALVEESEYTCAFERAVKALSRSNKTKKQLVTYLKGKSFDNRVIGRVINKLEEYGYLDDSQFATTFIEIKKRGWGKRRLEAELNFKGVDAKIVEEAVSKIDDEDENAYLVAKKYCKTRPVDYDLKVKAFRYLVSKGFTYDSVNAALDRLIRESGGEV